MHKCCTLNQTNRPQRRINGLQLPLNYLQVIGWIVFVITCVLNFAILVQIQVAKVKITTQIIFAILYVAHVVSHVTATLLDPSEKDLRKLEINTVPEFDRNIHAHVIENGRCHICNIYTSSKKTKHCSLCNKCVNRFDHHCKWLNNCVGQRNYGAFIASVTTAFLLSLMTALLCLVDIVLFVTDPQQLSVETQHVANCSIMDYSNMSLHHDIKICRHSIMFLIFLVIFCVSAVAVACALMHLLCFHIYIAMLGVSTYEYILRSSISRTTPTQTNKCTSCPCKLPGKLYIVSKSKTNNNVKSEESATKPAERDHKDGGQSSTISGGERNVASFIGILVNNELDKAKRIFMNDKNRIHPQEEIS